MTIVARERTGLTGVAGGARGRENLAHESTDLGGNKAKNYKMIPVLIVRYAIQLPAAGLWANRCDPPEYSSSRLAADVSFVRHNQGETNVRVKSDACVPTGQPPLIHQNVKRPFTTV